MLEHLGEAAAAALVRRAVDAALGEGKLAIDRRSQPEGGTRRAAETIAAMVRALAFTPE